MYYEFPNGYCIAEPEIMCRIGTHLVHGISVRHHHLRYIANVYVAVCRMKMADLVSCTHTIKSESIGTRTMYSIHYMQYEICCASSTLPRGKRHGHVVGTSVPDSRPSQGIVGTRHTHARHFRIVWSAAVAALLMKNVHGRLEQNTIS